jgi:hypothetical protein
MKRLAIGGIALGIVVAIASPVKAATIGNTILPTGKNGFALGLDVDIVSSQKMELDKWIVGGVDLTAEAKKDIKRIERKSNRIMLKASYGLIDQLDVFCKIGMADLAQESKSKGGDKEEIEDGYTFCWGLGGNGIFYELPQGVKFGASAQYLSFTHKPKVYFTPAGGSREKEPVTNPKNKISELQVALYALYPYQLYTFYGGVKYSNVESKFEGKLFTLQEKYETKSKTNAGLFAGITYNFLPNFSGCLEVRLLDETSFTVGGTYKLL